jgi:vacuolar protein sorting-associated protein VTA1
MLRQTADTFLAASTFFELLNIWGEPDPGIHAKIRYAKWNAVRIAKAIKEGKDPNESNPKPEPTPEENLQPLDPNDPEVQQLGGQPTKLRQASVEEVPDEQDRVESRLAAQSLLDRSLHPSAQPSARASPGPPERFEPYPRDGFPYSAAAEHDVSPIEPADIERPGTQDRNGSIGGGYFPEVPTFTSGAQPSTLGTAPATYIPGNISPPDLLDLPQQPGPSAPGQFDSFATPEHDDEASRQPQNFYRPMPPQQQHISRQPLTPSYAPPPAAMPAPAQSFKKQSGFVADDVAMAKAQKHARFAISALTFDDPDTAVKELRAALQTLGAN